MIEEIPNHIIFTLGKKMIVAISAMARKNAIPANEESMSINTEIHNPKLMSSIEYHWER